MSEQTLVEMVQDRIDELKKDIIIAKDKRCSPEELRMLTLKQSTLLFNKLILQELIKDEK